MYPSINLKESYPVNFPDKGRKSEVHEQKEKP